MLCFLSRICFFIVSLENPYLFFEAQMGLHLFFSHLLFPQYWMCNSAWVLPSLYGAVYLSLFFLLDLQDFLRSGIHFSCLCILNTPSIEPDSWVALKKYCQYLIKNKLVLWGRHIAWEAWLGFKDNLDPLHIILRAAILWLIILLQDPSSQDFTALTSLSDIHISSLRSL